MEPTNSGQVDASLTNGDINASVGLVNVGHPEVSLNPTLELNFRSDGSKKPFAQRFLEGARQAINPVRFTREEARAREIRTNSIGRCCAHYRNLFPSFDDNQIAMLVFGYSATPAEADNVASVLGQATNKLADAEGPINLPPHCRDEDIKGAKTAYEDGLRDLWSSLIAYEITSETPCSRRTKKALESMSAEDAKDFEMLCSFSPWARVGVKNTLTPIPAITSIDGETWTYNGGRLTRESLATMESLGLIVREEFTTFSVPQGGTAIFEIGDETITITPREATSQVELVLGNAMFLNPGTELARVCDAPANEALPEILCMKCASFDIRIDERNHDTL